MALENHSVFYYGYKIDSTNNLISFDEGGGELTATISPSNYTLNDILLSIKTAMEAVGSNTYTVTTDRDTRVITISADGSFDLLLFTGTQISLSPWITLGFNQGVDLTSASTYSGDTASGDIFEPQFILQDYVDPEMKQQTVQTAVNESASGILEVISFGIRRFVEFSLKFVTSKSNVVDGHTIKKNDNGKADCERFLQYLTTKGDLEFMPNINDKDTFLKLIVESMPGGSDGTGYELTELVSQSLPGIFEINNIKCRVVE